MVKPSEISIASSWNSFDCFSWYLVHFFPSDLTHLHFRYHISLRMETNRKRALSQDEVEEEGMAGNLEGKKMKGRQIPHTPEARLKAEKNVSAEEVRPH